METLLCVAVALLDCNGSRPTTDCLVSVGAPRRSLARKRFAGQTMDIDKKYLCERACILSVAGHFLL